MSHSHVRLCKTSIRNQTPHRLHGWECTTSLRSITNAFETKSDVRAQFNSLLETRCINRRYVDDAFHGLYTQRYSFVYAVLNVNVLGGILLASHVGDHVSIDVVATRSALDRTPKCLSVMFARLLTDVSMSRLHFTSIEIEPVDARSSSIYKSYGFRGSGRKMTLKKHTKKWWGCGHPTIDEAARAAVDRVLLKS